MSTLRHWETPRSLAWRWESILARSLPASSERPSPSSPSSDPRSTRLRECAPSAHPARSWSVKRLTRHCRRVLVTSCLAQWRLTWKVLVLKKSLLCKRDECSRASWLASVESLSARIKRRNQRTVKALEDRVKTTLLRMARIDRDIVLSTTGMTKMTTKTYRTVLKLSDQSRKAQWHQTGWVQSRMTQNVSKRASMTILSKMMLLETFWRLTNLKMTRLSLRALLKTTDTTWLKDLDSSFLSNSKTRSRHSCTPYSSRITVLRCSSLWASQSSTSSLSNAWFTLSSEVTATISTSVSS